MARVLLVTNRSSSSAGESRVSDIERELYLLGEVEVLEPSTKDAFSTEVEAAASGADIVVAAGGDGTFNLTVNALVDRLGEVTLGLVPMGTGNDLARSLGLPFDPVHAARAISAGRTRTIDVGRISWKGGEKLFVNACMGGFPVEVDDALNPEMKRRFGTASFWVGGAKALASLERFTATINGEPVENCVAAGVGNGRSCGGGIKVWPDADPGDGLLDACALPVANPIEAVSLAAKVRRGTHGDLASVRMFRASAYEIGAEPGIEFNIDGELVGAVTPAGFELAGRATVLIP